MRVVFFVQGREVPAARFRGWAIAHALAADGVETQVRAPVPSVYGDLGWAARVPGLRSILVPVSALCRLGQLRNLAATDVVFFQRPLTELPTLALERLAAKSRRTVFDFDDAIHLNWRGREKLRRMVELVDHVIAGNRNLADAAGAPTKTVVIPTAVDTTRWIAQPPRPTRERDVVVGWTGLSGNYRHLAVAAAPIARALRHTGARFLVISDRPPPAALADLHPEFVRWSVDGEIADLARLDVGVMPLPDGPRERGKCAFKLIQYMALGRPGVASPVGANAEVVRDGMDGFLPRNDSEWEEHLMRLIREPELRAELGWRARARIMEAYSLDAVLPSYRELLCPAGDVIA
jgi:glycosyltransferase involved in cell wall biosynthesis